MLNRDDVRHALDRLALGFPAVAANNLDLWHEHLSSTGKNAYSLKTVVDEWLKTERKEPKLADIRQKLLLAPTAPGASASVDRWGGAREKIAQGLRPITDRNGDIEAPYWLPVAQVLGIAGERPRYMTRTMFCAEVLGPATFKELYSASGKQHKETINELFQLAKQDFDANPRHFREHLNPTCARIPSLIPEVLPAESDWRQSDDWF